MAEFDAAMVERLAAEAWECFIKRAPHPLATMLIATSETEPQHTKLVFCEVMRATLRVLPLSAAALNALWRGEAAVVPKVLTAAMVKATERVELADSDYPFTTFEAEEAHAIFVAMLAVSPYAKETKDG